MKILKILRKKWSSHRVYKYTLKYSDALSKSKYHKELSEKYLELALQYEHEFFKGCKLSLEPYHNCQEHKAQSEHFKTLSEIYLSKKNYLEKELQSLIYNKV